MLDIKFVRENPDVVDKACESRQNAHWDRQRFFELDEERRSTITEVEALQAQRNAVAKQIGQLVREGRRDEAEQAKAQVSANKERISQLDDRRAEVEKELFDLVAAIPNIPHESVPYGVDAISDGLACLELAAACEAKFVRGTFSGVYVGDGGLYDNDFSMLQRRRVELHLDDLKMLYFINPESDRSLDTRALADIAASTIFKVHPDGLCVSANAAGADVDTDLIASVKAKNPEVAVLVNTGCRPDTIESKLEVCDAAVVGTYFKEGGKLEDEKLNNVRVDVNRVKEFMDVVYQARQK